MRLTWTPSPASVEATVTDASGATLASKTFDGAAGEGVIDTPTGTAQLRVWADGHGTRWERVPAGTGAGITNGSLGFPSGWAVQSFAGTNTISTDSITCSLVPGYTATMTPAGSATGDFEIWAYYEGALVEHATTGTLSTAGPIDSVTFSYTKEGSVESVCFRLADQLLDWYSTIYTSPWYAEDNTAYIVNMGSYLSPCVPEVQPLSYAITTRTNPPYKGYAQLQDLTGTNISSYSQTGINDSSYRYPTGIDVPDGSGKYQLHIWVGDEAEITAREGIRAPGSRPAYDGSSWELTSGAWPLTCPDGAYASLVSVANLPTRAAYWCGDARVNVNSEGHQYRVQAKVYDSNDVQLGSAYTVTNDFSGNRTVPDIPWPYHAAYLEFTMVDDTDSTVSNAVRYAPVGTVSPPVPGGGGGGLE